MACKLRANGVGVPLGTFSDLDGDYEAEPSQEVLEALIYPENSCGATTKYGWICTRAVGHTGLHVARTDNSNPNGICAWWPK